MMVVRGKKDVIQLFEKQLMTELVVQPAVMLSQSPFEPLVNLQIHVSGVHMGDMCTKPTGTLYSHSPRYGPALNKQCKQLGCGPLRLYTKQIKLNLCSYFRDEVGINTNSFMFFLRQLTKIS